MEVAMSYDRDWEEERESVLKRLFNATFGRSDAPEDEIGRDIHWLGTVNGRLRDDDDDND
jgi:hypothetical protein